MISGDSKKPTRSRPKMFAAALDQLNFYRDPGFALRVFKATAFRPCRTPSFHLYISLDLKVGLSACGVVRKRPLDDGRPG
jgi:hypothetical protein